jgi:methylmalonyl-CoA carboxyltransferase small subunit
LKLQIGIDGKNYEVDIEVLEDDEIPHHPYYGSSYPLVPATVHSIPAPAAPAKAPAAETASDAGGGDNVCRSPVTGVVVKVNVEPGQVIQENELIMVLEAMKMETNVTAPHAGTVKKVRVATGDAVKVNQVVVDLE